MLGRMTALVITYFHHMEKKKEMKMRYSARSTEEQVIHFLEQHQGE